MKKLTNKDFLGMISSGAANLENHEKEINTLNVFPVPDGDTGTNMMMTFNNGNSEARNCLSNNICDSAKALSKGLLMGARGNSGVITSQIFRGFAKAIEGKNELSVNDLANGFIEGARTAYKAIMKPIEGTILTVIKESAYYANKDLEENKDEEIEDYISSLYKHAKESLDKTPELLQALKEAGVVDSGGAGLTYVFEGFKLYLEGKPIIKKDIDTLELTNNSKDDNYIGYKINLKLLLNKEYQKNFDLSLINKRLEKISENIILNSKDEIVDISVSTIKPGEVLNVVQRYGEFISLNIENPSLEKYESKKEEKEYGVIAVASGEGLTNLFYELNADIVLSGGQTMNPSTQDFVNKIDELDYCKNIIILPNNSNIILAAEQAKILSKKDIVVIPTKSIQAGISALSVFNSTSDLKNNEKVMSEAALNIKTAQVTYAVKDTSFDGVNVKENDFISIVGKTIIDSGSDLKDICIKTIEKLLENKDLELLTIITGDKASEDITNSLVEYVEKTGQFEVEVIKGDQPVYSYLFGLE